MTKHEWPNERQSRQAVSSSFGFRHSFVIRHSTFVIFLRCLLLLFAQAADAGIEKYSSFVLADKYPHTKAQTNSIRVTYLGVNGFQFETDKQALLVDPYFTRVGFWPAALNRRIESNSERVSEALNQLHPHPDAILVTHAHFDHLLDVPELMKRTGARLLSGPTAIRLVESLAVSPQLCLVARPGTTRTIGPWKINVLSAQHDRLFGKVPFDRCADPISNRSSERQRPGARGEIEMPLKPPVKASDWCVGEPLAFVIEATGKRIYIDSGGLPGASLGATVGHVDLAILGVALPDSRQRFAKAVRQLQPRYTLPSHQDDFFVPLSRGFTFGKLTNFPALVRMQEKQQLPGRLILLDYFRPWTLP